MRCRIIISLLFLLAGTTSAFAQLHKPHWEIEAGVCVLNADHANFHNSDNIDNNHNGIVSPTISLGAGYVFSNNDIAVFLSTFSNYAHRTLNGGPSPLTEREFIVHLMPEFRYYYFQEQTLRVYLSVGAGVKYRMYNEEFRGDVAGYGYFVPSFQISPICFSMGRKFSFNMDIGFGRPYMPFAFKVAYRFL